MPEWVGRLRGQSLFFRVLYNVHKDKLLLRFCSNKRHKHTFATTPGGGRVIGPRRTGRSVGQHRTPAAATTVVRTVAASAVEIRWLA